MQVDSTGSAQRSQSATSVVGFSLLQTGRRRMLEAPRETQHWDSMETDIVSHMLWDAPWVDAGEPCRSLVHAYRAMNHTQTGDSPGSSFGVMDRHRLKVHGSHTKRHFIFSKLNWGGETDCSVRTSF